MKTKKIAIIGAGPAGLMASEIISAKGYDVEIYEKKASVGRKFLMAGRGGLNLTHSEDFDAFIKRYGNKSDILEPIIRSFTPKDLREWCEKLGENTFVGSSGRVFPESFKASPLLRKWIRKIEKQGVKIILNHEWCGWDNGYLVFKTEDGIKKTKAEATLLTLGGASWPRLGSDGSWYNILKNQNISIEPFQSANCGFITNWSAYFSKKYSGKPLKTISASIHNNKAYGEIMITEKGVEGGPIYALGSYIREEINKNKFSMLYIDFKPNLTSEILEKNLKKPKQRKSFTSYMKSSINLSEVAIGLLMERSDRSDLGSYSAKNLAILIKNFPLKLLEPFPIEYAISTAGGVMFSSVDKNLMLISKPSVFVAGEMLDWEAPTGGYLLQASMATGAWAAQGIIKWVTQKTN